MSALLSRPSWLRRPSPTRVRAIAALRVRRLVRTRRAALAVVMTMLPWLAIDRTTFLANLAALTDFTVVGLTVLGAGAVAEDLDGGQFAIAVTHRASPVDTLAGEWISSVVLAMALVVLQLPLAHAFPATDPALTLAALGWLVTLLAGWMSLMLLAATWLPGIGNAIAMIPVLIVVPLLSAPAILGRIPEPLASALEVTLRLLPTPQRAQELYRWLLDEGPAPREAAIVVASAPLVYFALAAHRLARLEPAGRVAA